MRLGGPEGEGGWSKVALESDEWRTMGGAKASKVFCFFLLHLFTPFDPCFVFYVDAPLDLFPALGFYLQLLPLA